MSPAGSTANRVPRRELGQEDFLRLLTVQLASQDPLKPMDDTAFIAQMAQFSALEQSSVMTREMVLLRADGAWQAGAAMLGHEVTVTGEKGEESGVVEAVEIQDGAVMLRLGDTLYPLTEVIRVAPAAASPTGAPS